MRRFGILQALFDIGLCGCLALTVLLGLRCCLALYSDCYSLTRQTEPFTHTKKNDTAYSSVHSFHQEVHQGGVLSCTLFSLTISGILESVSENVNAALHVDNLLIYSCGTFHWTGKEDSAFHHHGPLHEDLHSPRPKLIASTSIARDVFSLLSL